ncbi:MAG: DUF5305 family protein [Chloroflexota bacterium]
MERRSPRRSPRRLLIWLAAACAIITLAGAGLAVLAFRTPLERERTEVGTAVSQHGRYSWTALLTPNHLYDSRKVTGETTIFTNITKAVNMEFNYQVKAAGASGISGTYAVDLTIRAGEAWSKRQTLLSPAKFAAKGDTATLWAQYVLDIPALSGLIADIERETGVGASEYTLVIQPTVTASLTGAGIGDQSFAAPLELVWSADRRQIIMPAQREFYSETSMPVVTRVPATLALSTLTLPVRPVRIWSLAVTDCALLLAVWLGVLARRAGRDTTIADQRLRRANARLFIEGKTDLPPALPTIEVRDLTQLIKVARETAKPVVHAGSVHYVVDSGIVYLCGEVARAGATPYPALVPRRQRRAATADVNYS